MVDEYVAWYDRHLDPAWQDVVLTPPDAGGARAPWAFVRAAHAAPTCARMGRCFAATIFPQRRQHHPHAGLRPPDRARRPDAVRQRKVSRRADRQRRGLSRDDRAHRPLPHLLRRAPPPSATACATDPAERAALQIVRETDAGLVLRGKVGMHTSPAFAEDVYIGATRAIDHAGHRATFVVPVNAPGVTVICRKLVRARPQPVPRAAQQPLRRARRPDVARRRARAVGPRLPDRAVARADRPLAVLAPALLLAGQGRVHAGPGAGLRPRDGARGARADDRVPARPDHRRADRADLPDRRRARPRVAPPTATASPTTPTSPPAASPC